MTSYRCAIPENVIPGFLLSEFRDYSSLHFAVNQNFMILPETLTESRSVMKTNGAAVSNKMYVPPLKVLLPATILLWMAIALFNTGIFIFSADEQIQQYGFIGALRWTLFYHSPWLVLIPCILFCARKFPLNGKISFRNFSIHFILAVCVTFIASLLHTLFIYVRLNETFEYSSLYINFFYYFDDRFLLYFVVLVGYYAVDFYQKKNLEVLRELKLQEKLNRENLNRFKNDIQPAFLLNTLKDIQKMVPGNAFLAERLIADLAHMIRKLLISSQNKTTSTYDDLQFLRSYVAILGTRLGRQIHFHESVNERDKGKDLAVSLLIISIVEKLLSRDKHCFAELSTFNYETFETAEKEGIVVKFDRLLPARPGFEKWVTNGGTETLTGLETDAYKSSGTPELRYTTDGLFSVSITFPKRS